jgi:hypothetical protein
VDLADELRRFLNKVIMERGRPPLGPPDVPDRDPPDDDDFEDWADRGERREGVRAAPAKRVEVKTPEETHLELDHMDDALPSFRGTLVVGIKGDVGPLWLGQKRHSWASNCVFVGLTEDAVIGPIVQSSDVPHVRTEFHNVGIRAAHDSFGFRQITPLGHLVFKNWWFVDADQTSGMHLSHGLESFHAQGYQPRDSRFLEHAIYKKGGGRTQILDNDMRGSGRSFYQERAHGAGTHPYPFGATPPPSGPIIIDGNTSDGFGWDHEHIGGGAVISVWCSLEHPVVIRANDIQNCRTGGIMVGQGATNTHPPLTHDEYSHSLVWLEDNIVKVNGSQGSDPRHAVSISATRELVLAGTNVYESAHRYDLVLDAEFSWKQGAKPNGGVHRLGRGLSLSSAAHWVPSEMRYVEL